MNKHLSYISEIITIPKLSLPLFCILFIIQIIEDLVSFRKVAEVNVLLQSVNSLRPGTIQKLEVVAVCICNISVLSMYII